MQLTPQETAAETTGTWRNNAPPAAPIRTVSTDTRTVAPGDCFVALKGESYDAHDFIAQAVGRGATSLIVHREFPEHAHIPQLIVADTLHALGNMARAWRRKFPDLKVAAIVGSSGKTTTKEMAAEIVGASIPTLSTRGNLNNLIGLPRTLFELTSEHRAAILELGMNMPGEARRLVEIAEPNLVLLTNIRDAHVGMFGTMEALYEGECENLRYAPPNAAFLLNETDPLSIQAMQHYLNGRELYGFDAWLESTLWLDSPLRFQGGRNLALARDIQPLEPYGYAFTLTLPIGDVTAPASEPAASESNPDELPPDTRRRVELHAFGRHNIANAAAAAALARWFGVSPGETTARLTAFRPRLNRSEVEQIDGWWILKDYYNAVPTAVESALASLRDFQVPGRRYALLGDMRELGDFEAEAHANVGRAAAAAGLDGLFTIGERGKWIGEAAKSSGMKQSIEHLADIPTAVHRIRETLKPGDLILVKASRLMALENLYAQLTGKTVDAH